MTSNIKKGVEYGVSSFIVSESVSMNVRLSDQATDKKSLLMRKLVRFLIEVNI